MSAFTDTLTSRPERQRRIVPLRNHNRVRKFRVQHSADVAPYFTGRAFRAVVALHQRIRHIDAEAVTAFREPEAHNILDGLPRRKGGGMIRGQLPRFPRMEKAVIQRGLAFEKVHNVSAVALAFPADERTSLPSVPRLSG